MRMCYALSVMRQPQRQQGTEPAHRAAEKEQAVIQELRGKATENGVLGRAKDFMCQGSMKFKTHALAK